MKDKIKAFVMRKFEKRIKKEYEKEFRKSSLPYFNVSLTKAQKKETKNFFKKNLGKDITTTYHQYYMRNGVFSPKYIPISTYRSHIVYRLNDFRMKDAYIDKNQYEKLFPNVKHPETVIKRINGYYYSKDKAISEKTALDLCSNLNDVIIKPSLETTEGDRVVAFSTSDGVLENGKTTVQLFNSYGKNFIVQKKIIQHSSLAALNKDSVNSIRLLTYRKECEVVVLYAVMRIGRIGKVIDNVSAGGISVKIDDKGCLGKYAYSRPKDAPFEKTDSGIVLEGYQIPKFDEIKEKVRELHLSLPYFKLAGWDMTLDEHCTPVMIEWNVSTDLSQSSYGPAFGEYTEEILNEVKKSKTTRHLKILGTPFGKEKF